jgi:hypothetical protein
MNYNQSSEEREELKLDSQLRVWNTLIASSTNIKEINSSPMLGFLKEAETVTLCSLESLLLFISDPEGFIAQRMVSNIQVDAF